MRQGVQFNISTEIILGNRDSVEAKSLESRGWKFSKEFTYHTIPLGKVVFSVFTRVDVYLENSVETVGVVKLSNLCV